MQDSDIGFLVKNIDNKLRAMLDAEMKTHNLTMVQSFVVIYLKEHGGITTQKDIEDVLQVSHPAVVGIVSRMEQNGFLKTWLDPKNKRNKMVELTGQADDICAIMAMQRRKYEEIMTQGLTEEEIRLLRGLLSTVYYNLTASTDAQIQRTLCGTNAHDICV